jgi:2-phosphoglycerate kinase
MLAMAEADGEVAVRDPNQVISEIESTRENLARTIDALTERVSPSNVARRSLDRVREQVARPEVQLIGGAVALVTAAAVAYSLWRRRR